jgi:hypothetical protein
MYPIFLDIALLYNPRYSSGSRRPRGIAMDQIMTIEQINAQFDSEWVLLEDPLQNDNLAVQGGKVLHHSKDRDEVYRKAVKLRPKRFAVLYTGTMPPDTAIVL